MKKLLFLILPFLLVSCTEEWLTAGFEHQFDGRFEVSAEPGSGEYTFDSETIELGVMDKIQRRNLADMSGAELRTVSLEIAEESPVHWHSFTTANLYMLVDGEAVLMATQDKIAEETGLSLDLMVRANEEELMQFLDSKYGQVRLVLTSDKDLDVEFVINMVAGVSITAFPHK